MKLTDIITAESLDTPVRVSLDGFTIKVGGKEVSLDGQWVEVISTETDIFKDAEIEVRRSLIMGAKLSAADVERHIQAALVVGWSFEDECNLENKVKAFKIWPKRLASYIIRKAEGIVNVNFTLPESKDLLSTPESSGG